jgi:hypothetical protein
VGCREREKLVDGGMLHAMYALASVQRSADKAPAKVPQPERGKGTEPALLVVVVSQRRSMLMTRTGSDGGGARAANNWW